MLGQQSISNLFKLEIKVPSILQVTAKDLKTYKCFSSITVPVVTEMVGRIRLNHVSSFTNVSQIGHIRRTVVSK